MTVVYRDDYMLSEEIVVLLPRGSNIIHVEESDRLPGIAFWYTCDPYETNYTRRLLKVVGTGIDGVEGKHIRSFCVSSARLWFHVFDCGEVDDTD